MKTNNNIWCAFENECAETCEKLKTKFSESDFKHAFETLSESTDDCIQPNWSDATKAVWTEMDRLFVKYNDQIDDDNAEFCGVYILFEEMEPRLTK